MAVEKHCRTPSLARVDEQPPETVVIGMPVASNPALGLGKGQLAANDRPPLAHDARDNAQTCSDPRIRKPPDRAGDQRGIEIVSCAVQIEAGPWYAGGNQRSAVARRRSEEFVDKGILG